MASSPGISAFPEADNLLSWVGTITGAPGTVYDGLIFKLSMKFPANYPYAAPTIRFDTPCYHPNVDTAGNICLDILKVGFCICGKGGMVLEERGGEPEGVGLGLVDTCRHNISETRKPIVVAPRRISGRRCITCRQSCSACRVFWENRTTTAR
ncbi:ubiquitin-conjugating enzyme/RWD-like protein [Jimgerdemannia flammicorona]|uniref:Ubiquitin-conjugating enzyme/RWD-like protein n=1 Tax=Jimgerdemannia flammicorona TaxID=994334 RepID=A0A433PG00_9FUNG|nr:ubiquitin-conjugating enzyme/RWD-like protein [Jimgerdemannia flammicorona]